MSVESPGMLDTVLDRHIIAVIFVEGAFKVIICSWERILAAELIEGVVAFTQGPIVLCDGDGAFFIVATILFQLLYFHFHLAGS